MPTNAPVTMPEELPAVATAVLLLLHVPPATVLCKAVVPPAHTVSEPVIGATGFTVMVVVIEQPPGDVYLITEVPGNIPVTTPEDDPIVAIVVEPLVQVPPVTASVRVIVLPWQTDDGPVMPGSSGRTVTVIVELQPVGEV